MVTILKKYTLLTQIKIKQRKMYVNAKKLSFTDPRVVDCSQQLDKLLNEYQSKYKNNLY
ncbi:aspartyl-phosphate phosphatase Spo0E family protein [Evansella clarkii]|jgi:stage 0 sporulation regulatory protein|uniref:aspartyl-phosphate phosphatase Spo0E family protein n=1 Tax=Evansella clarkii TaxID=79879 RepID=UPI0009988415|nr:aspartyl-phosphate phosphatase Spo0E family protein [Evansella clarkii]